MITCLSYTCVFVKFYKLRTVGEMTGDIISRETLYRGRYGFFTSRCFDCDCGTNTVLYRIYKHEPKASECIPLYSTATVAHVVNSTCEIHVRNPLF